MLYIFKLTGIFQCAARCDEQKLCMCYSADYLVIFWLQCHCSDELRGIKPADEGLQLQVDTGLLTQVG